MRRKLLHLIEKLLFAILNVVITKPGLLIKLVSNKKFLNSPSYYPEKKRKSKICILWDNIMHICKYNRIEEFYFAYGFDIKGCDMKSFVDYSEFMYWRDHLNRPDNKIFEYTGVVRDKLVFNLFVNGLGFPSSSMIGLISEGKMFLLLDKINISLKDYFLTNNIDIFCKAIDGEDGKGIYKISNKEGILLVNDQKCSLEELLKMLSSGKWTVERRLIQHPAYAEFHPKSVNTLRIFTIRDVRNGEIVFLPSAYRVGAWGNNVDNWARGGLIIRLYEDGTLGKYGFYRPTFGTKTDRHPDTGVVFEGRVLPWVKEAFQLVKEIHGFLYGIHSIGWDVAVTEDGPVVIEANDNWEITLAQMPSHHGCQAELDLYFKGINK